MTPSQQPPSAASGADEKAAYSLVTRRLLPLLFICYVAAYLDRVNVGFAKLQMLNDLKFSEAIYGLGAGIFFIGYFFFEVPSNLLLHKFGARRWIARILITWGIISGCMMFVETPAMFYVLRFFLGVAEAGFFPGIILFLTYWYPSTRRSQVTSLFMTGIPMAGVIGGPLSGWIMGSFNGVSGLAGWQWMFIIEAIPSVLLGFVVMKFLDDRIADAVWLSDAQKQLLQRNLDREVNKNDDHSAMGALRNPKVWVFSAIYFCIVMGLYGIGFWLPSLIKTSGVTDPATIGWLVAIPYLATVVCMTYTGRRSDRTGERRWHIVVPIWTGAVALVVSTLVPQTPLWAVLTLSFATMGIITGLALSWALPTALLGGAGAAAGIALINSVGNLAGFASPFLVGWIKDVTGSANIGLYLIAACLVLGGIIVLQVGQKKTGPQGDQA